MKRRDGEDLRDRIDALRTPGSGPGRKRRSDFGLTVLGLLLVAGVLGAIYLVYFAATGGGVDASSDAPVTVTVSEGETLEGVSEELRDAGVIESATVFEVEARFKGYSTDIKPGEYEFRPGQDSEEILDKLTAGEPVPTFSVTIPEGLTIEQTAEQVAEQSGVSAAEFGAAAKETDYGYAFLEDPAIETTEGFLFPKQYEFEEGATARQVVARLLEQYYLETQTLDFAGAEERLGLSEYEILTVASLIERESANAGERPLIASVIYNRLRKGMPLQIDASIQYALEEPKEELSLRDLEVDSPYNTYERSGLPPGPIASPSRDSIEAALEPAKTDYLYYVLKADGQEHAFATDYDDFLRAKAEAGR